MKIIKQLFCKHTSKPLIFVRNLTPEYFHQPASLWKCPVCGKEIIRHYRFIQGEVSDGYHTFNELKETIELMQSTDYKDRFKAEYWQTKIRYEKLKRFCNKIEARDVIRFNAHPDYKPSQLEPIKHDCPFELLRTQQRQMGEYLHTLEVRAEIEGIEP